MAKFVEIAVKDIIPDKNQPRQYFAADKMRALKESIKRNGLKQPIVVEDAGTGKYLLIDGERRFRAIIELGHKEVPAVIEKPKSKAERLIVQFTIQEMHESWTPVEKAKALIEIAQESGITLKEATQLLNIPDRTANGYIAFAGLADQANFVRSEIPLNYAFTIKSTRTQIGNIVEKELGTKLNRSDEKAFEAKIISLIKEGEITKNRDITKIVDFIKQDPKLFKKFVETKVTSHELYKSSNAEATTAVRQAYHNALFISSNIRIFNKTRGAKVTEAQQKVFKDTLTILKEFVNSLE